MTTPFTLGQFYTLGWGQKTNFFRIWSCCIKIKWNPECSNMIANILPADNPPPQNMVMLHIKGNVTCTPCSNVVANVFPADPWGWGQKVKNSTCSEYGHVAYQIKSNGTCSYMVANDPDPLGQEVKISTFLEHGHVAYQIKWNHECCNVVANILLAELP